MDKLKILLHGNVHIAHVHNPMQQICLKVRNKEALVFLVQMSRFRHVISMGMDAAYLTAVSWVFTG